MTATNQGGAGPVINDINAYNSSPPAGISIVTFNSRLMFKADGSAAQSMGINTPGDGLSDTYRWQFITIIVNGTIAAGDGTEQEILEFAGNQRFSLYYVRQTDSTYKLRVKDQVAGTTTGTSSSTFNAGTAYALRARTDGSLFKLDVDGTEEISGSQTNRFSAPNVSIINTVRTPDVYYYHYGCREGTAESDRPGDSFAQEDFIGPDGDDDTGVWGGKPSGGTEDCGDTLKASYTHWDDWNASGQADDDTEYNCILGGNGGANAWQTSTMQNPSITVSDFDNLMVQLRAREKANVGGKGIIPTFGIKDSSGNRQEKNGAPLDTTDWALGSEYFSVAPDGGAWTQAKLNDLSAGFRLGSGSGANLLMTAQGIELLVFQDDPPAVAADPGRRGIVQVI